MEFLNGENSFELSVDCPTEFIVRTRQEFIIELNGIIVAPSSANDRFAKVSLSKGDTLLLDTDGKFSYCAKRLPSRGEVVSSESLCEVIPDGELSMYDRLRAELLGKISDYAESRGLDSFEDDGDYDFPEDEDLIDTPYEYAVMHEEYLAEKQADEKNFSRASPEQGEAQQRDSVEDTVKQSDTSSSDTTENA